MNGALSLEEAQARILALAPLLPLERVDVPGTLGRYIAEPLLARRTQPASHVSAMDGYAVRETEIRGPWRIVGESAAGHPWLGPLGEGEAVRISTGAIIPPAAGAVIVQEDTARDGDVLTLIGTAPAPAARHIRRAGMDFCCDDQLLAAGMRIGPAQIALALAAGHRHIAVRRPPRIAILDSGDELAADPEVCPPHQIPASNGAMIAAMVASIPAEVRRIGPLPDNLDVLVTALGAANDVDVIVTTGGASVGDHDLIRPALQQWGATLDFWRVAIKPGKPLLVARKGRQMVIGLPGNPVSSMVTAYLFLLPLLRAMLGASQPLPRAMSQTLSGSLPATGGRREFVRAAFSESGLAPLRLQDSGALSAMAATDALIDRPPNSPALPDGSIIQTYLLQNGGLA